jgi:hypothetical protein
MASTVQRQAFVALPLLRAIEQLPASVEVDGITLRFTGEVTSAPIVRGFSAYRARCECDGATGQVDLSSASSWRSELSLRLEGISAARAEQLLLALRTAMVERAESGSEVFGDGRIGVCRSA